MTNPTSPVSSGRTGRGYFVLGIACALVGLVGYAVQMSFNQLATPWYAPAMATAGACLAALSLWKRRSVWRILALLMLAALAGLEWWFLLSYTALPTYAGPVVMGEAFPEFKAQLADGKPFQRSDLEEHLTALVFFRGHW
jgi:hypothetical protein